MNTPITEILIRFMLTTVILFFVGLDREKRGKSAGITTHIILGISTCALGILQIELTQQSLDLATRYSHLAVSVENQRLIAQIVTGIGFLGAGSIFKSSNHISGLTTAATLWMAGVLGLIIGLGFIELGLILGVLGLIIIRTIKYINKEHK